MAHRGSPRAPFSARNMLHYWAIRQCDLRDLQARLTAYGLSSLGRSEPHVAATLLVVRSAIGAMLGECCTSRCRPGCQSTRDRNCCGTEPGNFWDRTRSTA